MKRLEFLGYVLPVLIVVSPLTHYFDRESMHVQLLNEKIHSQDEIEVIEIKAKPASFFDKLLRHWNQKASSFNG